MRSYEQPILDYIIDHPGCTRKNALAEFSYLDPKTVYLNIRKLLASKAIEESHLGELKATRSTRERTKDSWPVHRFLTSFTNVTEITNAYACQDDLFRERITDLRRKYGEVLGLLSINITLILAMDNGSDMHTGFHEKKPINREQLEMELKTFEAMIERAYELLS